MPLGKDTVLEGSGDADVKRLARDDQGPRGHQPRQAQTQGGEPCRKVRSAKFDAMPTGIHVPRDEHGDLTPENLVEPQVHVGRLGDSKLHSSNGPEEGSGRPLQACIREVPKATLRHRLTASLRTAPHPSSRTRRPRLYASGRARSESPRRASPARQTARSVPSSSARRSSRESPRLDSSVSELSDETGRDHERTGAAPSRVIPSDGLSAMGTTEAAPRMDNEPACRRGPPRRRCTRDGAHAPVVAGSRYQRAHIDPNSPMQQQGRSS